MAKFKPNEVVYHVLMHHINHYKEAKEIFKVDYDSHIITIIGFAGNIATVAHCTNAANATTGLYVTQPDISITFEN